MIIKRIVFLIMLVLLGTGLRAQSNTMYYMSGPPQSYYLNPASQPQPNIFLGLPVLNSPYFEVYHNSIGLSDIIWNDPETGEVLHPFHPDGGLEDFLNKFEDVNRFSTNLDFSLISFGFRVRKLYFTMDVTSRFSSGLSFSNELTQLALVGNEDGAEYNFSSIGFNLTEYAEIGLGVSRKFGDMITVGIRPKLLLGIANISSGNNNIDLYTSHEVWQLNSHLEMQFALPGVELPTDETGTFDPAGDFVFDSTLTNLADYRNATTGNKGFGIDLGIHVKPMKELTLSASVIDLGVIKWNNYAYQATLEGDYEFRGIEYSPSEENGGETPEGDTASFGDFLTDSLLGNFNVDGSTDPFTTRLEPKIFIGASYAILPKLELGLLARFDLPESGFEYDLMLHANWKPSSAFGISATYSPFEGGASTFGLGIHTRTGPFNIYAVADYNNLRYTLYRYRFEGEDFPEQLEGRNIPLLATAQNRSKFNIRIGINLVLGWNQRKRLMKDKPMYYSDDY